MHINFVSDQIAKSVTKPKPAVLISAEFDAGIARQSDHAAQLELDVTPAEKLALHQFVIKISHLYAVIGSLLGCEKGRSCSDLIQNSTANQR